MHTIPIDLYRKFAALCGLACVQFLLGSAAWAAVPMVSAGYTHSCALNSSGSIACWGSNEFGELGNGGGGSVTSGNPVAVAGISNAVAVSVGVRSTCAVVGDGAVLCWGANDFGQLGNGNHTSSVTPVAAVGISNAVSVSIGGAGGCAVLRDGTLQCWDNSLPKIVQGLSHVAAVSVGWTHRCVSLDSGSVQCWGNFFNELGGSDTIPGDGHQGVIGITDAVGVSAGGTSSCAVLRSGGLRCWGDNGYGQLGNGSSSPSSVLPVAVADIDNAVAVTVADTHACALLSTGAMRCWGSNYSGQLGTGRRTSSLTPVAVAGVSNATAVAAGGVHTCALLSSGAVQCWGANLSYQLGNVSTTGSPNPATVMGIDSAIAVSAGDSHTCAVLISGEVRCWGQNFWGELFNATTPRAHPSAPVTATGIGGAKVLAVAAGASHTCILFTSGAVRCAGSDSLGQLGTGRASNYVPSPVLGINALAQLNVLAIAGSALGRDAELVFNWAEKTLPQYFAANGLASLYISGYWFRAYAEGHFLAVNDSGAPHLNYLGPVSNNTVLDLGPLADFVTQASK